MGSKVKVLIVDDNAPFRGLVRAWLGDGDFEVHEAPDGAAGVRACFALAPDLLLLDVHMPGMDGWGVLERVREMSDVPVLFLTGVGESEARVRGLRKGADDYIQKSVGPAELKARVEAVLRRSSKDSKDRSCYRDHAVAIDFSSREVFVRGARAVLTPTEYRMLSAFTRRPGAVLSAAQLLDACWAEGIGGPENVRVYVGYLRRKIEEDPNSPRLIETVRGFGYRYRPCSGNPPI